MENLQEMECVLFDYGRSARTGLPEAVFCEKKPLATLIGLLRRFMNGDPPILFTRLEPEIWEKIPPEIKTSFDYDPLSRTAFAARLAELDAGAAAIVTAGSADAPVAHEAARALHYLGISHTLFEDCGVAGLWRLTSNLEAINAHDAIIIVAGMEGALSSVLGGLSPLPIFAVPTSVGYGVSAGGKTALAGMLASCAPGVACLNIDNGYGAACAVARTINLLQSRAN